MVQRILFVHAHPDDESISAGGTIATFVDSGAAVTVLTLTRGERGEVIPAELRHLEGTPQLADWRETELADAMTALGVTDHRFLGAAGARWRGLEPRRYEDSGMRWGENGAEALDDVTPASLSAAPFAEIVADVAAVVSDTAAELVISENANGGYGHPDHVLAHRASRLAAEVAGARFLAIEPEESSETIPVDVSAVLPRKRAALAAHRTQLIVDDDSFTLSNGDRHPISSVEHFRPVRAEAGAAGPAAAGATAVGQGRARVLPRLAASIIALIGGAVIGALGTAVHQAVPPLGVILALVMVAAVLGGLRVMLMSRLIAAAAALGVLVTVALLATPGAGGSVLIPATTVGYVWTFGPAVVAFIVLAWPRLPQRSAAGRMNTVPEAKDRATP